MIIRKARESDLGTVVSLWNDLAACHDTLDDRFWARSTDADEKMRAWMAEALSKADRLLLVADQQGIVVGFLHATLRDAPPPMKPRLSGHITDVVVPHEHARQGIGIALVAAAERWFLEQGAENATTTVAVHNQRGRAFWAKNGFSPWTQTMWKRLERPPGPQAPGEGD